MGIEKTLFAPYPATWQDDIAYLRVQIDSVDVAITMQILERIRLTRVLRSIRLANGGDVSDLAREHEVIEGYQHRLHAVPKRAVRAFANAVIDLTWSGRAT